MGWTGVITDAGNAALLSAISTGDELNLNAVKIGTGTVDPSNMRAATALNTQVGSGSLKSKRATAAGVQVVSRIVPLSSAYTIKEVGIFATLGPDDTPILFALFQNADGIEVPASSVFPEYCYDLASVLDIDNLDNLTITVDSDIYLTEEDLEGYVTEEDLADAVGGCVALDQGSGNAGKFLVVGNDGEVVPTAIDNANGVSF